MWKTFQRHAILFSQAVLIKTIQLSISTQFSPFEPKDKVLSGATTPAQCGPGINGNEVGHVIPQSFSITGTSPSEFLLLNPGHSLEGSYPSVEVQSQLSLENIYFSLNQAKSKYFSTNSHSFLIRLISKISHVVKMAKYVCVCVCARAFVYVHVHRYICVHIIFYILRFE